MLPESTITAYKTGAATAKSAAPVEEFLQLLARAVRQFHTYPETSPLCTEAVAASHKALASLDCGERLVLRVTPREFVVDDTALGAGTIIEQELVRRLHKARVAGLDFERHATPRDLSRFCTDVIRVRQPRQRGDARRAARRARRRDDRGAHGASARGDEPRPAVRRRSRDLVDHEQRRRTAAAVRGARRLPLPARRRVGFASIPRPRSTRSRSSIWRSSSTTRPTWRRCSSA